MNFSFFSPLTLGCISEYTSFGDFISGFCSSTNVSSFLASSKTDAICSALETPTPYILERVDTSALIL